MSPKGTGELHPALSRVDTGNDDGSDLDTHGIAGHGERTHIYGVLLGTLSSTAFINICQKLK